MRPAVVFLLFIAAVASTAGQSNGHKSAPSADQTTTVEAALERVAPSLVRIHVVSIDFQKGRELKREAAGSGTIITPKSHIVTNHHVADKTRSIMCTLATREEIPADLVGTDPLSNIAVLKLRPDRPRKFPIASFDDA